VNDQSGTAFQATTPSEADTWELANTQSQIPADFKVRIARAERLGPGGPDEMSIGVGGNQDPAEEVARLLEAQRPVPRSRFISEQEWEGRVLGIANDVITASFVDRAIPKGAELKVDIDPNELAINDRQRVKPGAVLYWSIGRMVMDHGQTINASVIRVKRPRPWTRTEEQLAREASQAYSYMFWNA